jgi:PAT family beta-lactamase induction signal transducer AmpG
MSRVAEVFRRRHVLILFPLGFAAGLPYLLTSSTLAAWLTSAGVPLGDVGLFAIVTLPYSLKLLWAPLLDRYALPLLGRRRGWLLLFQLALGASLIALGAIGPRAAPLTFALTALAVTFFAASQDVVSDAYRTDLLAPDERAAGTAVYVFGYRVAMLVTGGVMLVLADHIPFGRVYQLSAALLVVGILATLLAPEPPAVRPPATLRAAVVEPLTDWFTRPRALALLAFLASYRLADLIAAAMVTPFLFKLGFSNTDVGLVNKNVGIVATIAGTLGGGAVVARYGLRRPLIVFGFLTPLSTLAWSALAVTGKSYPALFAAVAVHNVCVGLGIATLDALILTLCNRRYGATQYALLSSAAGFGGRLAAAGSGYAALQLGWPAFFTATAVAGTLAVALTARSAAASTSSDSDRPRSP